MQRSEIDSLPSLPYLFFKQAALLPGKPFLFHKSGSGWSSLTFGETAAEVRRLAARLVALGVMPGERVLLVTENRPEFLIADLAIMSIGGITVPTFVTNTSEDHRYVLDHSGARGAIFSSAAIAKPFLPAALQANALAFLIAMEDVTLKQSLPMPLLAWNDPVSEGDFAGEVERRMLALERRDVCCIIYTSGTGGAPKGVMLSHGSILGNIKGAFRLLEEVGLGNEAFLSFLPLSHAYEHTAGQFLPIAMGAEIWYAESVERLSENMLEARPTIMTAVPRLYEAIQARMLRNLAKLPAWRQKIFHLTIRLGRKRYENPRSLSLAERLLDKACDLLVRRQVMARFGSRLKAFVSGGAALNHEVGLFFLALGIRILQGYGQTEASPVISANRPGKIKIDSVGPVFDGLEARLAADGEILVRGEAVMTGYWRDEAATRAALRDGWLHTGDIGTIDEDGYLRIVDRKKDLIVLSGGDNVSPARVEGFLTLEPEIGQAMVDGDGQPHLVALIVPEAEFRRRWSARLGHAEDAEFHKVIAAAVERVNAHLSPIEKIRRFTLLPEGFTIENGMLTPSLKIRRHKIRERWGEILAKLHERG